MKTYRFTNGEVMTSKLSASIIIQRLKRLDILRVMTEQHGCKEGISICNKAVRAYNKMEGFTGIIRLTAIEKDWLTYMLENSCITNEERKVVAFYTQR